MTVYVDDMEADFGRMKMCHMMADSTEELLAMVDMIGVQRKWIQYAGTFKEHFDISLSKRKLAIIAGAKVITWREMGEMSFMRRFGFGWEDMELMGIRTPDDARIMKELLGL